MLFVTVIGLCSKERSGKSCLRRRIPGFFQPIDKVGALHQFKMQNFQKSARICRVQISISAGLSYMPLRTAAPLSFPLILRSDGKFMYYTLPQAAKSLFFGGRGQLHQLCKKMEPPSNLELGHVWLGLGLSSLLAHSIIQVLFLLCKTTSKQFSSIRVDKDT